MLIQHTNDSYRLSNQFDIYFFKPKINSVILIVIEELNIDLMWGAVVNEPRDW